MPKPVDPERFVQNYEVNENEENSTSRANLKNNIEPEESKREVRSFLVSRDPSVDRRFRPRPNRQVALFQDVDEVDDEVDLTFEENTSSASTITVPEQEGALIYLRMRPLPQELPCSSYKISKNVLITSQFDSSGNANKIQKMEKHFTFSEIFDNAIDQPAIYEKCIRKKIEAEENFTILTYGTSGSGKTYTLLGDFDKPGIIPRAIENIYAFYADNLYPQPAAKLVNANVAIVDDDPLPQELPCSSYKISKNVLITSQFDSSGNANKIQKMEKHFTFSEIFDNAIDQPAIYEKCIRKKIEAEENFTILTYGTSGSGKTYTLLGDFDKPGIIPRAIENIYAFYADNLYPQPAAKLVNANVAIVDDDSIRKEMLLRQTIISQCNEFQSVYNRVQQKIALDHDFHTNVFKDTSVFIWISFVEIYNELVYDLLSQTNVTTTTRRQNHKIIANDGKVFIKDLTSVHAKMASDAYKLLCYGLQKVKYASTAINANSSRSHCIFFVDVIKYSRSGMFTTASYKFCDLAGSERLCKTGNVGSRLKEAQRINTSLMVLGRCLDAANNNHKKKNADVIPFRESKLTMLLQSALLGKEKLSMVVNITPSDKYFEENMNVLGFSSIAKNIVFKMPIAKTDNSARYSWFVVHAAAQDKRSTAAQDTSQLDALLEENFTLRNEIERLEKKLSQQEYDLRNQLVNDFQKSLEERKRHWQDRNAKEVEMVKQMYENKIAALKRKHARDLEDSFDEGKQMRRASLSDLDVY